MNNKLIGAFEEGCFDATTVAGMSHSKIDVATRWAVINNKVSFLNSLRPHSKYKTRGGAYPLMRLAFENGSGDVIQLLSSEITAQMVLHNNGALIAAAYSSSSTAGARWIVGKRNAWGLSQGVFAQALRQHCLSAHSNVVDYLAQTFPQQHFEWFGMAQNCAEDNDPQRCMLFLNHARRSQSFTPRQLVKVIYTAVEYIDPPSFGRVFACANQLFSDVVANHVNLPYLFKIAVGRSEGATEAVGALVQQFGHVDCRSVGCDVAETIEAHKARHLNNTISSTLPDGVGNNRCVRKL